MSPATQRAATVEARTPDDWKRIFALLDRALELDDRERTTWMTELVAGGNPDAGAVGTLLERRSTLAAQDFASARRRPAPADPDPVSVSVPGGDGQCVGPYRLLREIGRGGTATVWLAERSDGLVARRVALKRPDMSWHRGSVFAARMTSERAILASLTHPNIARLYDAGIEADGRPWLALEYIDGVAIDRFAERHDLSMHRRVTLIRDVARAVGYAHAQLVVHRDLKPSNLLVDATGTVHLVDFGIAKLIDPGPESGTAGSQLTIMAGRPLTPDYASPEQIRGETIGTASDVYSLGVVAFELFAGVRPYHLAAASEGSLATMHAQIAIPRASDVSSDTERAKQLRGDLDAVLRRMLGALPADRYATMDALADDLDRHLSGEPVAARSASRGYVMRRWVGRHKLETGIGIAVVVALFGHAYAQVLIALAIAAGALVAIWQRDVARKQAALARTALERGEQVKNFVASIFTQAVPRIGQGGTVAATDLLKAAARRVETDLAGQPAVAAELGVVIGTSFIELGDLEASIDWLPKAAELCERQFGAAHPLTLRAQQRWAQAANMTGDLTRSQALLPSVLRHLRSKGTEPELLVEALICQSFVLATFDHEAETLDVLREAIEVAVGHAGEASAIALRARETLANTLGHFLRHAESLEAIEPALAPAYALFGAQRPHPILTVVERGYADALSFNQRPRDATLILRQVVVDQRALDVVETMRVRHALHMLARALTHRGRYDEAVALFREATAIQLRLVGPRSHETAWGSMWIAIACGLRGDGQEALAAIDEAFVAVAGEAGVVEADRAKLVAVRALGEALVGRNDAALASIASARSCGMRQSLTIETRMTRVRCIALRQSGDVDASLELARSTLAELDATCIALEHGLLLVEAARCARALGRRESADRHWREALAVWDAGQVDGDELRRPLIEEFAAR